MPRRRASQSIAAVLGSAENLRDRIAALPAEVRDETKELALAVLALRARRRGRPPKLGRPRGRPRKVRRPRKVATVGAAEA